MRFSEEGIRVLKLLEGFKAVPYKDGPGHLTIGYGHMLRPHEIGVITHVSEEEGHQMLIKDVEVVEKALCDLVTRNLTQSQWDALVMFGYNIDLDHFAGSATLNVINEGDLEEVPTWIAKWNKITIEDPVTKEKKKVESKGLNRRRSAEIQVWRGSYPKAV